MSLHLKKYIFSSTVKHLLEIIKLFFQIKFVKDSLNILNGIKYNFVSSAYKDENILSGCGTAQIEKSTEQKYLNETIFQLIYFIIPTPNPIQKLLYMEFKTNDVGSKTIYVEITNVERIPSNP